MSFARLAAWLGPWAPSERAPSAVRRETWLLRDGAASGRRARTRGERPTGGPRRVEAYVYKARQDPLGTWLVAPGLHFDGPDDPRMDRFCRILARAGYEVVAPFVPAYLELTVHPSAADDLELVARALVDRLPAAARVTLFSISFGSWPALEVAARLGDRIDAVVTFGGYAEFESAVRFCVDGLMRRPSGNVPAARDPLNQPALFINMLPWLDVPRADREPLAEAWREMTHRTWGRMELKQPGRLEPFAREIVQSVPAPQRELFLVGCGVAPGGAKIVERALEQARDAIAFTSPLSAIERLCSPVVVCHGRDDDVIPWSEAEKLHALVQERVPARLLISGLYGHTGAGRPTLGALAREARVLFELLSVLSAGGSVRRRFTRHPKVAPAPK